MAIAITPWAIKVVKMLIRGFHWCGTEVANGGRCLVAWVNVACPTHFGSLGLPDKTWVMFWFPVDRTARAFFDASIPVKLGDGLRALF
jgi:hypothetical protein